MTSRKILLFPHTTSNQNANRRLSKIIQKAGMSTIESAYETDDELQNAIADADIVLVTANDQNIDHSTEEWKNQVTRIKNYSDIENKDTVVWCKQDLITLLKNKNKTEIVEQIKHMFPHQHFINYNSMIKLVDDLRNIRVQGQDNSSDQLLDVTLIANEMDRQMMEHSSMLIDSVLKINSIAIDISKEDDYARVCSDSILQSKLCVVLAQKSTDWAINFSKQIWKITGGASSNVRMLVVFDKNFNNPKDIELVIPNVQLMFTDETLAGLEIKVFFDKIMAEE